MLIRNVGQFGLNSTLNTKMNAMGFGHDSVRQPAIGGGMDHHAMQNLIHGSRPASSNIPHPLLSSVAYADQPREDVTASTALVRIGDYQKIQLKKIYNDGANQLFLDYLKEYEPSELPAPSQNKGNALVGIASAFTSAFFYGGAFYCTMKLHTTDNLIYGAGALVSMLTAMAIEDYVKEIKKPVESASAQEYQKSDEAFEKFLASLQNNPYLRAKLKNHMEEKVHNQEVKKLVLEVLKELDDKQEIIESL